MEINDLLALVRAGYTKEEITGLSENLSTPSSLEEPSGSAAPPADPAPVPEAAAPAAASPAAAASQVTDNSEVLAALKELTKTIQRNAILRDDLHVTKQDDATDILGRIINPTGK